METTAVLVLNTAAIAALQEGGNKQAIGLLIEAIRRLQQNRQDNPTARCRLESSPSLASSDISPTRKSSIFPTEPLKPTANRQEDLLSSAFYNRAFFVPTIQGVGATVEIISCTVLFNMALAWHRQYLASGDHNSLIQALYWYQRVHEMVKDWDPLQSSGTSMIMSALYLNMSQIYAEIYQIDEARRFRRLLSGILSSQGSLLSMGLRDFSFFNINLYCASCEDFRVAPAA